MTQNVFWLWLLDFDRQMQGRQVFLLLDNCPGHIPLEKFAEMNMVLRNSHFLLAAKHDLDSPTLWCWDHTHIQSVLQKAIQQPTYGWLREQHRQFRKDQHFGCVSPSSSSLGGGCFACHNRQLLPPLQNPDQRHHPHTTRGSWSSHRPYPGAVASSGLASIRESHGHLQSSQLFGGEQLHGGVEWWGHHQPHHWGAPPITGWRCGKRQRRQCGSAKNQHPSSLGVSGGSDLILDAAKGELSRV